MVVVSGFQPLNQMPELPQVNLQVRMSNFLVFQMLSHWFCRFSSTAYHVMSWPLAAWLVACVEVAVYLTDPIK